MTHDEVTKKLQDLAAALSQLEESRAAWAKKIGVEDLIDINAIQADYNAMAPIHAQQANQNPGMANPLQKQMDKLVGQVAHIAEIKSAMSMIDEIGRMADELTKRATEVAAATKATLA